MPIMSTSTKANDVIILLSDDEEESESTLVPNNTPISTPRYRNSSFLGEISIFDYNSNHSTTGNGIKKDILTSPRNECNDKIINISSIIKALTKHSNIQKELSEKIISNVTERNMSTNDINPNNED